MGFSAGGHLASTLGTHYNEKEIINSNNPLENSQVLLDESITSRIFYH